MLNKIYWKVKKKLGDWQKEAHSRAMEGLTVLKLGKKGRESRQATF